VILAAWTVLANLGRAVPEAFPPLLSERTLEFCGAATEDVKVARRPTVREPMAKPRDPCRYAAVVTTMIAVGFAAIGLSTTEPGRAGNLRPGSGAWWGGFVQKSGDLTHRQSVGRLEQRLGRRLKINHHYHEWRSLRLREERRDLAAGRIPLISWPSAAWPRGIDAADINAGNQDRVIRNAARKLKRIGGPVFLRFAFEMDQRPPSRRYIGKPRSFIRAWRRVHRIIRARDADNVKFVWCAVASNFASGRAQRFYPGDRYVQWIAADGFSFHPVKLSSQSRWRSFREIFKAFYSWGAPRKRPLMVAATGVQEDRRRSRRKAKWFRSAGAALRKNMRDIEAFVYWNARHPTPNGDAVFNANTSRASFRAYRRMGRIAYFNPRR
jgi:hypothetical protein